MGKTISPFLGLGHRFLVLEREDPLLLLERLAKGDLAVIRADFVAYDETSNSERAQYRAESDSIEGIRRDDESGEWDDLTETYQSYLSALLRRVVQSARSEFRRMVRAASSEGQAEFLLRTRSGLLIEAEAHAETLHGDAGAETLVAACLALRRVIRVEASKFVSPEDGSDPSDPSVASENADAAPHIRSGHELLSRITTRPQSDRRRLYTDAETLEVINVWCTILLEMPEATDSERRVEFCNRYEGKLPQLNPINGMSRDVPSEKTVRDWLEKYDGRVNRSISN